MRNLAALFSMFLFVTAGNAQGPYIPPDISGDAQKVSYGLWEQLGQIVGPDQIPDRDIQFYTEGAYPRAYIRRNARISLVLAAEDTSINTPDTLHRLDISFSGSQALQPDASSYMQKDYIQNFYMPWCGSTGVTNVHGYSRVIYENIYPFIDMHIYSGSVAQKFAFVIRPGGNPASLKLLLQGQDYLELDFFGNLKVLLADKWIYLRQAVAYQVDGSNNMTPVNWTASYTPNDGTGVVSIHTAAYDDTKPLVLLIGAEPMIVSPGVAGLCYSTYFGGDAWDVIAVNTIDDDGNHYVTGTTYSTFMSFPGTAGTSYFSGSPTLFACRMNDQDHVEWKNYFGGSGNSQRPSGIAVRNGPDPKVYVAGWTDNTNFYCQDANPGNDYFDNSGIGVNNGFIVRFDYDEGVLEHSTYFGNESVTINDITIDPMGRLIVVGWTEGAFLPVHQVPLPAGAEQWGYGGAWDGFIAMFNLSDKLLWSTPFGGTHDEEARTVCAKGNKIVVAGYSSNSTFPTFPQAMNGGGDQNVSTGAGSNDIMILEFNLNGDQQWGTLFGGSGYDNIGPHGLDIDPNTGDIYIVGYTKSSNLPLMHPSDWYDPTTPVTSHYNGFIAEFTNARNRRWVTYVTSSGETFLNAVRVSNDREIFIGGSALANFPCVPADGLYSTNTLLGTKDGVIMRFDQAHQYLWGTYFGGDVTDAISTIALKEGERLYACGQTTSPFGIDQFFPLQDEQISGSWYEDTFQPSTDGFVSAFCFGSVVGVTTIAGNGTSQLSAWPTISGHWSISGAMPGLQLLTVCDAAGRTVLSSHLRLVPETPLSIDMGVLSPGVYVLRVGERSARVLIPQR